MPENVIKEAAFGAALGMVLAISASISGTVGMVGILFCIQSFYQRYKELRELQEEAGGKHFELLTDIIKAYRA